MPVGRPISLTPNIATKTLSATATADQTSFTVTGGYRINELGVYRNGVRLVQGKDFTASDGSTVTLLSGAVVDDTIDFVIFDSFNIADAINSVGNQTIDGELTATKFIGDGGGLTGVGTANINTNNIKVSGITTLGTETTVVGSAVTFDASGGTIVGVLTATSFEGDGSSLTGVAATDYVVSNTLKVLGVSTFVGNTQLTATTASTSSATGALVVSGGVGIAGSLHVGENVCVGGTLTYEDVTNIDSVGIVTAQTGVKVTAGGIDITAGGLDVSAGISTFGGGDIQISGSAVGVTSVTWDASANSLIFKDSSIASFGNDTDLQIYHQDSINYIKSTNASAPIQLQAPAGEVLGKFSPNGSVDLYHNGNKKFETSNDGTVTTGIATASDFVIGAGGTSVHTALGTKASTGKAIAMAMVFG